jgi:serine/threonine protein kinase
VGAVTNKSGQGINRLTMPLIPGAKLEGYEVLGLLGAGGMGEVYRARDPVLKREVAIKVLPSFVSQHPDRLRRFEQEAQAAAALNHPNILAVYHFGVFEEAPYMVSELLVGELCGSSWSVGHCRFARPSIWAYRSLMEWRPRMREASSTAT